MKRFFLLQKLKRHGELYIIDDITSEGAAELVKQLNDMKDVDVIDVYISSFGGDVSGGLLLYNTLKKHSAKVITRCDGLMASAATLPFCAGEERVVSRASAGLIHHAWTFAQGNAKDFLRQAEELKTLTQGSIEIYKTVIDKTEEEISALMEEERWLSPDEMLALGIATKIEELDEKGVKQNMKLKALDILMSYRQEGNPNDGEEGEKSGEGVGTPNDEPGTDGNPDNNGEPDGEGNSDEGNDEIELDDDEVEVLEKVLDKIKKKRGQQADKSGDEGNPDGKPDDNTDGNPEDGDLKNKNGNPESYSQRLDGFFNALIKL